MQDSIFAKAKGSASALKDKIPELKEDILGNEEKQIVPEFKDGSMDKLRDALQNMSNPGLVFKPDMN